MSLVIFTCVVGLLIAPVEVDFWNAFVSILAVALGSGAAGVLNMWYEADLDSVMTRTCLRPIPTGKVTKKEALIFGILASVISVTILYLFSNLVAAVILEGKPVGQNLLQGEGAGSDLLPQPLCLICYLF